MHLSGPILLHNIEQSLGTFCAQPPDQLQCSNMV
jgi:hypothetical protein